MSHLRGIVASILFLLSWRALAQTTLTNVQLLGTLNRVENNAELTIASGGSLTASAGSVVDLFHAVVALPNTLTLKDTRLDGSSNELLDGATLTLLSGSNFVAVSGSSIDLTAASINFPTSVVLTTSDQTLFGKTLIAPVISSITAANATGLTLTAGSAGSFAQFNSGLEGGGMLQFLSKPNNGNSSGTSQNAPWQMVLGGSEFSGNGSTFFDDVLYFGYNMTQGGARLDNTKSAFGLIWESDFWNDIHGAWTHWSEFHLQSVTTEGATWRPFTMAFDRDTPANFAGASFSISANSVGKIDVLDTSGTKQLYTFTGDGHVYNRIENTMFHFSGTGPTIINDTPNGNISYTTSGSGRHNFTGSLGAINIDGDVRATTAGTYISAAGDFRLNDSGFSRVAQSDGGGSWIGGYNVMFSNGPKHDSTGSSAGIYFNTEGTTIIYGENQETAGTPLTAAATFNRTRAAFAGNLTVSGGGMHSFGAGSIINIGNNSELRLSDSYSRIAQSDGGGGFISGYNIKFSSGAKYDSAGTLAGQYMSSSGYRIYTGGLNAPGTAATPALSIDNDRNAILAGDLTVAGASTTTSTITGAFRATANAGIEGSLAVVGEGRFGGNATIAGGVLSGGLTGLSLNSSLLAAPIAFSLGTAEVARFSGANGNLLIGGTADIAGTGGLKLFGTSESSSTTTGAFQLVGGAGIGGALNVGGTGTFGGKLHIKRDGANNNELAFYNSNNSQEYGTIGIAGSSRELSDGASAQDLVIRSQATLRLTAGGSNDRVVINSSDGTVSITSTVESSSPPTGALVVAGGIGIAGHAFVGGAVNLLEGAKVASASGSLVITAGGENQDIVLTPSGAGSVTTGSTLRTTAATASISTSTGALVVGGGFGLGGNQTIGGTISFNGGGRLAGTNGNLTFAASGIDQDITLTPSGTGRVILNGSTSYSGTPTFSNGLTFAGGGGVAGTAGSIAVTASGTNQDITLTPSGTGSVTTPSALTAGGALRTSATTATTSSSTGALVVAGGFGLGGDQYMDGSLNFSGSGVITAGGGLSLTAGGTDRNITLTPSGIGIVSTTAGLNVDGPLIAMSTAASSSVSTGALVVAGGFGLAGNQTMGGALNFSGPGVVSSSGSLTATSGGDITLTAGGTSKDITLTPSGTGRIVLNGAVSYTVPPTFDSGLNVSGGGAISGVGGGLDLTASGANQNITLIPSGTGRLISTGPMSTISTAPSISTSTGALVVGGGLGVAGDQFLGGSLNLSGGGTLSGTTGALSLAAAGTDQNVSLIPSGTGSVITPATLLASGGLWTTATTASTSPATGALIVAGGFGLAGDQYIGGSLNFSNAAVISSSGSLALNAGGADQNITLTPSGTGGVTTPASLTLGGTVRTSATTASTSTSTGALVVSGGFGLAGNQTIGGAINFAGEGVLSSTGNVTLTSGGNVTITAGGTDKDITLTPSGTGRVVINGPVSYTTAPTFSSGLNLAGGGAISGTGGGLGLTASGTDQNITFTPSGAGRLISSGPITTTATNASTSASTGALVVGGGLGVAGDQYLGGALNLPGGAVVSGQTGALSLAAAGTNQNIALTPSGTGGVTTTAAFTAGGALQTTATTASTSPATGALTVAGGFGLAGDQYIGGSLNFSNAAVISSSGSLALNAGGTDQNITLRPSGTGGVTTPAPLTVGGTVRTSATTASTSTSTGALVVSGGFGLAGSQTIGGAINYSGEGVLSASGNVTLTSGGNVTITAGGTDKDITLTPSGTGRVVINGPVSYTTAPTFGSGLTFAGGGAISGTGGSLGLTASGSNENVTITPSGTGRIVAAGPITATATTTSTSISTGALVVGGGLGVAGDQFIGGSVNLPGGGSLSGAVGSVALTASGTDQNIVLTPSGSGNVTTSAGIAAGGNLVTTATTAATSTSTGALIVSGGAAIQKQTYLGDDLVVVPTIDANATVRVSGTAVAGTPGIWFGDGGSPTATNTALSGNTTTTALNGPSGGAVSVRVGNTNYLTINSGAATLQTVPLNVNATAVSTSTTTGSATFAGGIGVAGRTSTSALNVGSGSTLDLILSSVATLDFPSIAASGGVQDLSVTMTGANVGDAVNIVEADGTLAPAGIVIRAVVTATDTVTIRATNVSSASIDPSSAAYRITLLSF